MGERVVTSESLGAGTSVPRILLTADELHLVQDHVPSLRLPLRFRQDWTGDLGLAEAADRAQAALSGLVAKGLVAADVPRAPIPANLSDWLLESFMVFLSLHMVPAWVVEVSAWTRESTLLLVASARGGFGSTLARAQRVEINDGRGSTGDLAGVEFAVVPFSRLADKLSLAIPSGGEAGGNGPLVTMSLTDSRGGIEVLRAHDPLLLEELSRRIGGPDAVRALSGLVGDLDAGFELRLAAGRPSRSDAELCAWRRRLAQCGRAAPGRRRWIADGRAGGRFCNHHDCRCDARRYSGGSRLPLCRNHPRGDGS
ncbi:hypothetical protein E3O25_04995 [Cryobacterium sp. TMT1-3]|uniref:hypothetical protein n=1 Tax=Cryobacterium sp. TMT1-3 TaxID=1259237 RepID=UPI00106CE171|nr:hypothetical protein [Cryobacterium sp. TMT1-3]TFC29584.1 hypothetical protein E3O25_04995 [Cryobacterium sp. TMT1-3]